MLRRFSEKEGEVKTVPVSLALPLRGRENCEYWESAELKIRERKEKVKNNLEKLEEYLREVLTVLKDDDSPPRPK